MGFYVSMNFEPNVKRFTSVPSNSEFCLVAHTDIELFDGQVNLNLFGVRGGQVDRLILVFDLGLMSFPERLHEI